MQKLKLIRGARIVQQLLEKSDFLDLRQNIERGFPDTKKRQHATGPVHIVKLRLQPFIKTNNLKVDGDAKSDGKNYNPEILFHEVEFEEDDTDENVTFVGSDGEEYHVIPLHLADHNVKVRCDCMDFRWRFAMWNATDDSLIVNPPPPYRKKTDRPEANPQRVPGVCKHVLKTIERLHDTKVVKV